MTAVVAPDQLRRTRRPIATVVPVGPALVHDKPLLRGRLHQLCAIASVPAGVHLIDRAAPGAPRTTAVVFAVTWTLMFATSAAYHRLATRPTSALRMRRADHSTIFVHIAGAQTPLLALGLSGYAAWTCVGLVWAMAGCGVVVKGTRLRHDNDAGSWLYPLLGWFPLIALPALTALDTTTISLLVASGVVYGAGAVCFFRKWPDPFPAVFGYHEVWHVFTVVGGLCQFAMTMRLTQG